jgi:hypothetical protein
LDSLLLGLSFEDGNSSDEINGENLVCIKRKRAIANDSTCYFLWEEEGNDRQLLTVLLVTVLFVIYFMGNGRE